jgi:hypothetical protein
MTAARDVLGVLAASRLVRHGSALLGGAMNCTFGDDIVFVFPTNRDLLLIGVAFPKRSCRSGRAALRS